MRKPNTINGQFNGRVLIVTHSYAPVLNPRAFRWAAIAEQWAGQGYEIDVVSAWTPGLAREEKLHSVQIYRVGGGVLEKLRKGLRSSSQAVVSEISDSATNGRSGANGVKKIVRKTVRKIHDWSWKQLYWPDYACNWYFAAVATARRLLKTRRYDTIITVSDPFTSHLVGFRLKAACPKTKWLVDIGDPFCFRHDTPTNNHRLYRRLNYFVEGKLFDRADAVTVTTNSTRNKYAELFASSAHKIDVIGPLMAEPKYPAGTPSGMKPNDRKKLVFVGTLYRSIRNPKFLLQVFEAMVAEAGLSDVELHFFGGLGDCQDILGEAHRRLGDRLIVHGLVPREQVLAAMNEADVLINIGNDNPYQLPSKVVEYAWVGKPIVNLSRIENDSSRQFFADHPAFLNIHDDGVTSATVHGARLAEFINNNSPRIDSRYMEDLKKRFSVPEIAGEYSRHLTSRSRQPVTEKQKPIWHIYYGTRGTAGAYIDALLRASHEAGLAARAFVSSRYQFKTDGVIRCFFPITDRTERRNSLLMILRAVELLAGYLFAAVACLLFRPTVNIHLTDDLQVTYYLARLFKLVGLKLYVTCHDVVPHYNGITVRRKRFLDLADKLVVHNRNAKTTLINRLGERSEEKVVTYPFPSSNYDGILNQGRMGMVRAAMGRSLGARKNIFLFLGVVRKSKGIETLVKAWTKSKARHSSTLVVAGKWTDPPPELRQTMETDPTCIVINRYISDEEFVVLLEAARFAVLPYLDYSHSAILMSCGHANTAAIVSDINLFTELLPDYDLVFKAGDSDALAELLNRAAVMDTKEADGYRLRLSRAVKREVESLAEGLKAVYAE